VSPPVVEVKNLTKVFGDVVAVDDVSFTVAEKDFLVLLGPSGCGKTTILRMIAGLEAPTSGEITLKDRLVFSSRKGVAVPARERGVGLVFQSYALWPHMTVFENIAFGLRVQRMSPGVIEKKVANLLGYMQLEGMAPRYPQEMSGGQQQRVALARMLVSEPGIFLMDEPLSNLDAKLRLEMRAEIKNIHVQTGATTIYVTHDQGEGQTMATRIAVVNRGRIEQLDPPGVVYHRPSTLFIADFIGSTAITKLKGVVAAGKAEGIKGVEVNFPNFSLTTSLTRIHPGLEVVAAIRPENISIVAEPGPNTLEAEVQTVLPSGPETMVQVKHKGIPFNIFLRQEIELRVGQKITIYFPPDRIMIFDAGSGRLIPVE
jgi:multiple sugar transport system ATP-binding protein